METAAPENGTIFERLRGRECPETLKEMATRVHGMLKKTFTGQDIRVDYSEEKKNRPFVEDMENYLLHAQSGSLLTRLDVGCFREVTTAMYETLCKYGRGRLPTINPTRSKEIHEGLIEFQKVFGRSLRGKQNGHTPDFPLKALFRNNSQQVSMNEAAE